jgi:Sulfotransferase domain
VIREVPADRLLVIAPDAGWKPLCEFLQVPVPDEPYPHLNNPEKFWARVAARVSETRDGSAARVSETRPTESSVSR